MFLPPGIGSNVLLGCHVSSVRPGSEIGIHYGVPTPNGDGLSLTEQSSVVVLSLSSAKDRPVFWRRDGSFWSKLRDELLLPVDLSWAEAIYTGYVTKLRSWLDENNERQLLGSRATGEKNTTAYPHHAIEPESKGDGCALQNKNHSCLSGKLPRSCT